MTEPRQRMIESLQLRGLSERTQDSCVRVVRQLADHYHKSPDLISEKEIHRPQAWQHRFQTSSQSERSGRLASGYLGSSRIRSQVRAGTSQCRLTLVVMPSVGCELLDGKKLIVEFVVVLDAVKNNSPVL